MVPLGMYVRFQRRVFVGELSLVSVRLLWRALISVSVLLFAVVFVPSIGAQESHGDTSSTSTTTVRPLVTRRDVVVGALAVLATVAIAPLDRSTAGALQEQHLQRNTDLQHTARDLAFLGGPGPFVMGAGLFAAGRIAHMPRLAGAGIHMTEAVLLAASITGLGKGISGRALPVVNINAPENFQFGRGFHHGNGPYVSFPAGHAAASFAMAAAITGEADLWHPGSARIVGPVAYGTAGLIGLARMYQNVHWASDLPLAVAIGTWSGLTVVARSHRCADSQDDQHAERSGRKIEHGPHVLIQVVRSTTVAPVAGRGAGLAWSIPLQIGGP